MAVRFHKDYNPEKFAYDKVEKAWVAINGAYSEGRYFFVAHLKNGIMNPRGRWMAFLRRPEKNEMIYEDVPFDYEGFPESADAEEAVFKRAEGPQGLGWRIREIDVKCLPTEADKNLEGLL